MSLVSISGNPLVEEVASPHGVFSSMKMRDGVGLGSVISMTVTESSLDGISKFLSFSAVFTGLQ